ncbi:MAG: DUF5110 domain-containing protein [Balneolaceae bacterium]
MRKECLIWIFITILITSCQAWPEADYYEAEGIVSIHAGKSPPQNNWKTETYFGSKPMISSEDSLSAGTLSFTFYIQQPGEYALWVMSARLSTNPEQNYLPFRIEDSEGFLMNTYRVRLNHSDVHEWLNEEHSTGEPVMILFSEPGYYTILFESGGEPGYVVNRLHFTLNNERKPEGMGLPETRRPDVDPLLAKRDETVVLPPDWAFGMIYSGTENKEKITQWIGRLEQNEYPIDAYRFDTVIDDPDFSDKLPVWELLAEKNIRRGITLEMDSDKDSNTIRQQNDILPENGPDFLKLKEHAGPAETVSAYNATQKNSGQVTGRGFVSAGLAGLNDPDFKNYPTQRIETVPEWTNRDSFGLRETIEAVANPRLSVYEVPFLMFESVSMNREADEIDEEVLVRWLQFSAFNPIMTVSSDLLPYNSAGEVRRQFRELTHLRNRLFPYIYSQGHRVRASGDKPVTGSAGHPGQYMFGEAFLVAPVYEPAVEERQVYFSEGTWYNYWNDTRHEGNQSWFVETGLSEIPVFVKAGSIIPYREYSRLVSEGTNQRLTLEVYTGGVGTFRLYEDDGQTMNYQQGEFATTAFRYFEQENYATFTIGAVVGSFEGHVSDKEYTIRFKHAAEPAEIEADGQVLEEGSGEGEWFYDADKREIVVNRTQPNEEKIDFVIKW